MEITYHLTSAKRAKLLKFAKEKTKTCGKIEFVFADINCRIGLKTTSGTSSFLETIQNWNKSFLVWNNSLNQLMLVGTLFSFFFFCFWIPVFSFFWVFKFLSISD